MSEIRLVLVTAASAHSNKWAVSALCRVEVVMNRQRYKQLRHNIRASGYSWNWGSRVCLGSKYQYKEARTAEIALVLKTLLHPSYDKFEPIRPLHVLIKSRSIGEKDSRTPITKVQWQNWMRSNVRQDNRVFTEQLTSY